MNRAAVDAGRTAATPDPTTGWMDAWPHVVPRPEGPWAVGDGRHWGMLDPEVGTVEIADPTTDRRLPALAETLEAGRLIAYRPGRRAVVAATDGSRFNKVVRAGRTERIAHAHRLAHRANGYASPEVLHLDERGRIELGAVHGPRLHDLLCDHPAAPPHPHRATRDTTPAATRGSVVPLDALAELLRSLRSTPLDDTVPAATLDTPQRWIGIVGRIEPALVPRLEQVASGLPNVSAEGDGAVHGDLHDKNIIVRTGAPVFGVIDFDGLAQGAAEIDVANLAVHLGLRRLQGGHDVQAARRAATDLVSTCLEADGDLDADRIETIGRHVAFRLACLYRCRRHGRRLLDELVAMAATSPLR